MLSLILPGVAIFALAESLRNHWAVQQYALLWLLTVSAERSMPLTPVINAFAREQSGRFGRKAKRLAKMLDSGISLPDALDRCPKVLPRHVQSMIRTGVQSGALAPALRQAATIQNLHDPAWTALTGKVGNLFLLLVYSLAVIGFVIFQIIPAFEKIFKDFGVTLPSATQQFIHVAHLAINYWYILSPILFLIPYAILRYFGWIRWDLPLIAGLLRRLDTADILDSLALVARQERPMPEGVAALANTYPKRSVRRRLRLAADDIRSGDHWCESLHRRGLIRRADLAILLAAGRVGNVAWALQELAESGRRRFAYRLQAFTQAMFPPLVICCGLAVGFIVVALFYPLVVLIQGVAKW